MDSRLEVIKLIGEDFSIDIKNENPIFKTLSKFIGETVLVTGKRVNKVSKSTNYEETSPPTNLKSIKISKEEVWERFNKDFSYWNSLEDKEKPLVFVLLKNHISSFLDGDTGDLLLTECEENTFKRGNSYLIYESHK